MSSSSETSISSGKIADASSFSESSFWFIFVFLGGNGIGTGSNFGAAIIDILDYASTSKNKTVRVLTGFDQNGSGNICLASGLWFRSSPAAITSISLAGNSRNYLQYSQFALYAVKGA